jgi:NAD(P)H-dependent FMN reductase
MIKLGVIIGSTRPVRIGDQIGRWVAARAAAQPRFSVDLIDLATLALPFLDEEHAATTGIYQHSHTRAWSARIAALDAVVIVTAEYNSSFPAPLKNALDYLYQEWQRMPVGIVGYGGMSSGTRAVHALMPVVTHLGMVPVGSMNLRFRDRLDATGMVRPTADDDDSLDEFLANLRDMALLISAKDVPVLR